MIGCVSRVGNGNGWDIPGTFPSPLVPLLLFPIPASLPLLDSLVVVLLALGSFVSLFIRIRPLALGKGGFTSFKAAAGGGNVGSSGGHCCVTRWVCDGAAMTEREGSEPCGVAGNVVLRDAVVGRYRRV